MSKLFQSIHEILFFVVLLVLSNLHEIIEKIKKRKGSKRRWTKMLLAIGFTYLVLVVLATREGDKKSNYSSPIANSMISSFYSRRSNKSSFYKQEVVEFLLMTVMIDAVPMMLFCFYSSVTGIVFHELWLIQTNE